MPQFTPERVRRRFEHARTRRENWDSHWQEVADLFLPSRQFTVERTRGVKITEKIYNSTGPRSVQMLAAGLHGLLSSFATRWFSLTTQDFDVNTDDEVKEWLYDTTTRMLAYLSSDTSGFATASHEVYQDLAAFGTAVCQVMENKRGFLTFLPKQLANFYMLDNEAGEITDVFRKYDQEAWDVREDFNEPGDVLPEEVMDIIRGTPKSQFKKFTILHSIFRNKGRDVTKFNRRNMPWISVYMHIDGKKNQVLRVSGFKENPYLFPRWSKAPEETFGRSPATEMLPTVKMLNSITRTTIVAAEQAIHPPLAIPANGVQGPVRTSPGSITWLRAGTAQKPEPMFTGANPRLGIELFEFFAKEVKEAFFADKMTLPDIDRMTAEEVITRRQQGLILASPALARITAEWLNKVVDRTYRWMKRTRRLLPTPEALQRTSLKVEYRSPMIQSQKSTETAAILTAIQSLIPFINADPSIMVNIDSNRVARTVWDQSGADPTLLRGEAEVEAILQAQEEAAERAQQVELAQGVASASKDAAAGVRDIKLAG